MRLPFIAAVAALALPSLPARAADEPITIQLQVGEVAPFSGFRALCDDPSIAVIAVEGGGTLKALKAGVTLCSVSSGSPLGPRQVYRVVVVPPPPKRPGAPSGGEGGG